MSRIYDEQIDIFFDRRLLGTLDRVMVEANWKAECTQGTVVNGQPPPSHTLLITFSCVRCDGRRIYTGYHLLSLQLVRPNHLNIVS